MESYLCQNLHSTSWDADRMCEWQEVRLCTASNCCRNKAIHPVVTISLSSLFALRVWSVTNHFLETKEKIWGFLHQTCTNVESKPVLCSWGFYLWSCLRLILCWSDRKQQKMELKGIFRPLSVHWYCTWLLQMRPGIQGCTFVTPNELLNSIYIGTPMVTYNSLYSGHARSAYPVYPQLLHWQ